MSNNHGTGFWVVVALIAAMSVATLFEAVLRASSGVVARSLRRWRTAVVRLSRDEGIKGARA